MQLSFKYRWKLGYFTQKTKIDIRLVVNCLVYTYQSPAEENRASAVMGRSPGDELLNVVQLATYLYCPLQLVLQTLLEVL